jgi:hypothetical protein
VGKKITDHFLRDSYGRWTCIEPVAIELPSGHIEVTPGTRLVRGTKFMGVDVAEFLDNEYGRRQRP